MKTIAVLLLGTLLMVGCRKSNQQDQKNTGETAAASVATASIEVKTAKCKTCVKNITKALEQLDGVKSVSVDLDTKIARVDYVPSKITLASMEKAISLAGYDANTTKRNGEAYKALDACCQ